MQSHGVAESRITFAPRLPHREYLRLYHEIDIFLDTFPYNAHTTGLDSLYMGVPLVTMAGQTVVGRAGVSQLTNLGLPELIARTPEEFVRIAVELASDLPRLQQLRTELRDRMRNSPLMDVEGFTRDLESAYRTLRQNYCASTQPETLHPR